MTRREARLWPGVSLAVLLALFAFVLSFDALRVVGLACGIQPTLAWMFPLIIDGSTLAFTWAAWAFKTRRMRTLYPWLMLVVFSIISLIGNALHAHPVTVNGLTLPDWSASLIMTVPPIALLATTHMIVMAASRSLDNTTSGVDQPDPTPTVVNTPDDGTTTTDGDRPAPTSVVTGPTTGTATTDGDPAGPATVDVTMPTVDDQTGPTPPVMPDPVPAPPVDDQTGPASLDGDGSGLASPAADDMATGDDQPDTSPTVDDSPDMASPDGDDPVAPVSASRVDAGPVGSLEFLSPGTADDDGAGFAPLRLGPMPVDAEPLTAPSTPRRSDDLQGIWRNILKDDERHATAA